MRTVEKMIFIFAHANSGTRGTTTRRTGRSHLLKDHRAAVFHIFSPLVGSVLLMLNLRAAGYKRQGTMIVLFGIAWQFLSGLVVNYAANTLGFPKNDPRMFQHPQIVVLLLVLNIIGGGILAEYFFKKYFPFDDYEHKSIWKALLITLVVVIPLSMLIRM